MRIFPCLSNDAASARAGNRLPAALAALALTASAGCAASSGPEADAAAALRRGDQRLLAVITTDPEANTVWLPFGTDCYPGGVAPSRRVGRSIEESDRLRPYVIAYNRALVGDPRYRHAAICKPR